MDKQLLNLTSREVEKVLTKMGFVKSRQRGSHIQFVGTIKGAKRRVTLIINQTHFAPKTMRSMIEQSGLKEEDWLQYISH